MANNQITPFQLTDQFTMDNFNQRINETNTALQNNDPRNWALGTTATSPKNEISRLSVVDETISNGWYLVYLSDGGNIGGATQGTLSVDASSRGITQEFRFYYAGYGGFCKLTRIKPYQEEWQSWEYVNPPMRLGVEYRTTERYQGKPVYTKIFSFGALPNNTTKYELHGCENVNTIEISGVYMNYSDGTPTSILAIGGIKTLMANRYHVTIQTIEDLSMYTEVYIRLRYTKTTD